jgi:holo-[acyl-carrier protein] synthase
MRIRGVGIDVADTRRFVRLVERHGDAFAARWFTPEEVAECEDRAGDGGARALAAKYAAKEAVWKALGPEDWRDPLPWRGIAVLTGPDGRLRVVLSGAAARLAERLGVDSVEVSLCDGAHAGHGTRPGDAGGPALAIAMAGRVET